VEAMAGLVRRRRGEPHLILRPALLPVPQPDRSWITAAGVVLDTGSLYASALDVPRDPQAELCIRSGYLSLRRIADVYSIPYDPEPEPDDPISVSREEFDAAYDHLAGEGLPMKPDRDQAWLDFKGWRVNYDTVLVIMAGFLMAPYAPWVSDRSPINPHRPPLRRLGPRRGPINR